MNDKTQQFSGDYLTFQAIYIFVVVVVVVVFFFFHAISSFNCLTKNRGNHSIYNNGDETSRNH